MKDHWGYENEEKPDIVEVVRCRDCKHYAGDGMYCANDIIVKWDYFFCYDGEREDDESNR